MVGTATESVIRYLSEFKQEGIIDLAGRKIKILDLSALIKTANIFD
jgi:CRP/FNR family transcriptional regulator